MRSAFVRCFPKSIEVTQLLKKNALVTTAIFRNLKRCFFVEQALAASLKRQQTFLNTIQSVFSITKTSYAGLGYTNPCAQVIYFD